jgi:hypothetical protein
MPRNLRVTMRETVDARAVDVEIAVSGQRKRRTAEAPVPQHASHERIPRISRLMALAIKFDEMIARGEVRDYADLARLGHVTRARVSQVMNLLLLAPDLQERILLIDWTCSAPITERTLRSLTTEVDWDNQRASWLWLVS